MLSICRVTMIRCLALHLWIVGALNWHSSASSEFSVIGPTDFCQFEVFNVSCPSAHVILIAHARYGRMELGRCVKVDHGFVGCAADVKGHVGRTCSGQRTCSLEIDRLEKIATPCPPDFKNYLQVAHRCIRVFSGSRAECLRERHVAVTASSGYFSTKVSEQKAFGTASCPWSINVPTGMTIDFSLSESPESTSESETGCPVYVVVKERGTVFDSDLCRPLELRGRPFFSSKSSQVSLHFASNSRLYAKRLVHFQASGCADFRPTGFLFAKRDRKKPDVTEVKCNASRESWFVTCKDGRWMGRVGNCTGAAMASVSGAPFPQGLLLAVVIGVLLGVLLGAVLLVGVYNCRRRMSLTAVPPPAADDETYRNAVNRSPYYRKQMTPLPAVPPDEKTWRESQRLMSQHYESSNARPPNAEGAPVYFELDGRSRLMEGGTIYGVE